MRPRGRPALGTHVRVDAGKGLRMQFLVARAEAIGCLPGYRLRRGGRDSCDGSGGMGLPFTRGRLIVRLVPFCTL